MKKPEMIDALLKAGWPLERLRELEDAPFLQVKALWADACKKQKRVDFAAFVFGATEPQAREIVRWAGAAIDALSTAAKRAGVEPSRRGELLRVSSTLLAGMLAQGAPGNPLEQAKQAVGLSLALILEVDAACGSPGKQDSDGATVQSAG